MIIPYITTAEVAIQIVEQKRWGKARLFMATLFSKKWILIRKIILISILTFSFTGCNPTYSKKPFNFLNSVWVCEEACACVAVTEQQNFSYSYGEIEKDGKIIPVTIVYLTGPNGALLDFHKAYSAETIYTPDISEDKYLWSGTIDYTPKEFTLEETDVYPKSNILFSDDDLPLTFVRYDCTKEELLPLLPWDEEENLKHSFEPGQLLEFGLSVAEDDPKKDVWADIADFWTNLFNGTETGTSASASP